MKLNKLHICQSSFCSVHHSNTISSCNDWIRSISIDLPGPTCTQHCSLCYKWLNFICFFIQHICSIAFNVRGESGYISSQKMLCDELHCKIVLKDSDIFELFYLFIKSSLDLPSSYIFVVQNSIFRVTTFHPQAIVSILFFIKSSSP